MEAPFHIAGVTWEDGKGKIYCLRHERVLSPHPDEGRDSFSLLTYPSPRKPHQFSLHFIDIKVSLMYVGCDSFQGQKVIFGLGDDPR